MPVDLRFGRDRRWSAPWLNRPVWQRIAPVAGPPLDDPAAAIAAAVEDPVEFPPLRRAVIPGDRVAIAVASDLPERDYLLGGLLAVLDEARVPPEDVTICYCDGERRAVGSKNLLARARHVVHRPHDRGSMSYLAASAEAHPIYFPRILCDADVVIPLGCTRPVCDSKRSGNSLFPAFSDAATQRRWTEERSPSTGVDEAAEAAWLLGAQFAVEVVPGPGESVLHVIAGDRESVTRQSRHLSHQVWTARLEHRVDTVVATLSSRTRRTRWQDVARALCTLAAVVNPDAVVVLCTDLESIPEDAALEEAGMRLYLASDAPAERVEEAGLTPLESADELTRLVEHSSGGIVVEDADRIVVELNARADSVTR